MAGLVSLVHSMGASGFYRAVDGNVAMFFATVTLDVPLAIILLWAVPGIMPYFIAAENIQNSYVLQTHSFAFSCLYFH